jgi:hypothetical protein
MVVISCIEDVFVKEELPSDFCFMVLVTVAGFGNYTSDCFEPLRFIVLCSRERAAGGSSR